METDQVSELIHWWSSAASVTINPTLQQHFNLVQVITICNHVVYHKQPTITRLQRQLGMWNSYIRHPWRGREYHSAKPGYLQGGERREAAYPSLNIWQEKQDNWSMQVYPGQDVGCAFIWSRTPNQACTQMGPDRVFWGSSSSFLLTVRNQKICVCAYMSKRSSCFVWKRIKSSRGEMKIKRDAEFSGSTPWTYNNELK